MFVKITDGQVDQYPYTVGDMRRDNFNTSFSRNVPETIMAEFGVYPVGYQGAPSYNSLTHKIQSSRQPVFVNGAWTITKTVIPLTADQIASSTASQAANTRRQRETLLENTDWMALSDVTMSDEMALYRQSLRDITNHVNFPYLAEADWPVKP